MTNPPRHRSSVEWRLALTALVSVAIIVTAMIYAGHVFSWALVVD